MIISLLFLILASTATALMCVIAYDRLLATDAPFYRLSNESIDEILTNVQLDPKKIFYDLGCGDGRVLIAASKKEPGMKCIGVERALVPYVMSIYRTMWHENIMIIRGDLKKQHLKRCGVVYVYLMPYIVDRISLKLLKSQANGAQIVSVEFPLPNHIKPRKVHRLKHRSELASTWYLY